MQEESTLGSAGEPNALTETVKVLRECMKDQAGALEVKVPVDQLLVCLQYLSQHGPREVEMGVGSQTHIAEDAGGVVDGKGSTQQQAAHASLLQASQGVSRSCGDGRCSLSVVAAPAGPQSNKQGPSQQEVDSAEDHLAGRQPQAVVIVSTSEGSGKSQHDAAVQVQTGPDGMLSNALSIAQHEAARLRLEVLSLDAQLQVHERTVQTLRYTVEQSDMQRNLMEQQANEMAARLAQMQAYCTYRAQDVKKATISFDEWLRLRGESPVVVSTTPALYAKPVQQGVR